MSELKLHQATERLANAMGNQAAAGEGKSPRRKMITAVQKMQIAKFLIQMEMELKAEKPLVEAVAQRATRSLGFKVRPCHVRQSVLHGSVARWWPEDAPAPTSGGCGRGWNVVQAQVGLHRTQLQDLKRQVTDLGEAGDLLSAQLMRSDARVARLEGQVRDLQVQLGLARPDDARDRGDTQAPF